MAEPTGQVAEPVIAAGVEVELGPDLSIYGDAFSAPTTPEAGPPQEAEATTEEPATTSTEPVDSVADGAAPDSVDAQLEGDPNEIVFTRRNAQELVEKARAEAVTERERADALAKEQSDAQARQASLMEQVQQWNPPAEHYNAVLNAVKGRDWQALDAIHWTDDKGQQQQGFQSLDDALDYIGTLDRRSEQNATMYGYLVDAFKHNTGAIWTRAAERAGADPKAILAEPDLGKAMNALLDAVEAKSKAHLDAREATWKSEYGALKAKAGSADVSPDSGGTGASSGWNWDRYQHAVSSGEADKWPAEKRDQIVAECMKSAA